MTMPWERFVAVVGGVVALVAAGMLVFGAGPSLIVLALGLALLAYNVSLWSHARTGATIGVVISLFGALLSASHAGLIRPPAAQQSCNPAFCPSSELRVLLPVFVLYAALGIYSLALGGISTFPWRAVPIGITLLTPFLIVAAASSQLGVFALAGSWIVLSYVAVRPTSLTG
jgi:hypothetical protein